ncbi:MAG: glutamine amidotransferase [Clostridium sp.]|nr:glutamine amidotransferase [Clostridium sp.]
MKVLLAGESYMITENHIKGFDFAALGRYEEPGELFVRTLTELGMDVTYMPNHMAQQKFPETPGELSDYDVVILSDITSNTLLLDPDMMFKFHAHGNRLLAIKEFVEQGGGFVMIGGYMSYCGFNGCARYNMTPLRDIIPVKIMNYDDRVDTPEGVSPHIVKQNHPIMAGIEEPWPRYLGYSYVEERPDTEVLVEFNNSVGLACGKYGKGRSVAAAFDALPHWALPEVLEWKCYNRLWKNIINWAAGKI